ncbi:MAG: DUF5049 domain-containing protein [Synergistaceae bacterium]|nr:DUF5049 domain-containing protein [Synergistaceae bacterium]
MTEEILSQILKIRDTGLINMCDCIAVQKIAFDKNMNELVNYIEEDKARYFHFIIYGEEPD